MTKKSTKSALLTSSISLLLCFAMLLGTTFAWFTDSVTSANNIIQSGNLDVTFEYWNGTEWVNVSGKSDILTNTLWEPGVTEVAYLKVANEGSLALKYQMGINIVSETLGKNVAGGDLRLSDHLKFGVVENVNGATNAYANREAAVADVTDAKALNAGYFKNEDIAKDDATQEHYFALVVWMPTSVGNEANHNGENVPEIKLGLNVVATQLEAEIDSFDSSYDKDALSPSTGSATVPADNEKVEITASDITVTVPEDAAVAGDVYEVVVSNTNTETNSATGETSVAFDLSLYKNTEKVSDGNTLYAAEWEIGKDLIISNVKHNGTALTKANTGDDQTYTYDSAAGILTIYTKSFSQFEVTFKEYESNFADNKWERIIHACQNNKVPATWNVGDTKTMTIGDATYKIAIIGKNHDAYSDGSGKAPLTFQLLQMYAGDRMNETANNTTGWSGSEMRNTTMKEILSKMPAEVKTAIKAVDKVSLNGSKSALETTSDKLFLLSEIEVNGSTYYSGGYSEGSRYAYYTDPDSQIMSSPNEDRFTVSWWLRTPKNDSANEDRFIAINGSGYMTTGTAEINFGVVFGFCF